MNPESGKVLNAKFRDEKVDEALVRISKKPNIKGAIVITVNEAGDDLFFEFIGHMSLAEEALAALLMNRIAMERTINEQVK